MESFPEDGTRFKPGTTILPDTVRGLLYAPSFDLERAAESVTAAEEMLESILDEQEHPDLNPAQE